MSHFTFDEGRFAYAKQPGYPYWPCVVYNSWDEVPPEHARRLKTPLTTKEDEAIALWVGDWTFSVVKKANVKATEEVEEEDSVLKAAKSKEQRSRLRAAFDSMWEMEWFAVQERRRLGGCVPPPPPPPRLAAPAVPAPAPAPAAVAAAVTAVTATRTGAADEGRGNGQEAAAGSKKKPAAGNNKKRKHANDGAAPMEEAPATAGSALSAAAAAPAAKQPAKRFKSRCSSQTARACWAALVASQRKRKLSARAATAATPRQQQQPEGAAPAAVRPAVAGDNGKKKALLRARIAELEAHHAANTQLLRRAWGDLQSFRAMLRGIVGEEGVERAAAAAAAVPSPPPAAAKAGTGEGDGEKGGGGEGWCDDRSAYFDEPTRCLLEQVVDHTRRQRVCRALYEAMETARGRPPHALAFGFYTLEQVERVLAAARRLVRGDCLGAWDEVVQSTQRLRSQRNTDPCNTPSSSSSSLGSGTGGKRKRPNSPPRVRERVIKLLDSSDGGDGSPRPLMLDDEGNVLPIAQSASATAAAGEGGEGGEGGSV